MNEIRVGIIGTGFMGRAHALAYRAAAGVFPMTPQPVLEMVADIDPTAAADARAQFGFRRSTTDWRVLVADPAVNVVAITAPTVFHHEMALAAVTAGKHVHCEKPLAPNATLAREMMLAAEAAGIVTQVGYNYIKNPLLGLARDMVRAGELGDVVSFRGIHAEDYLADPDFPYNWRLDPGGGGGVIADLGSHVICVARFLLGPINAVFADLETAIKSRPIAAGATERRPIETDDIARLSIRFSRGCGGGLEASWVATGRKMQLGFEVTGTKGSLVFTQERLNELLYYRRGGDSRHSGFVRIETGPQHDPYGLFCVAPGHQLGFNDLKTIEVAGFLRAIAGHPKQGPDFREAWEIQKVVDAALASGRARSWKSVD